MMLRTSDEFLSTLANIYTCHGRRGDKGKFLMALLTGYFDESGIHEGDHYCVMAGFIGNDAQWGAVAKDWIEALAPRRNLHMTKLRWKQHPERIAPLLARLGPIPYKYNLTPIGVWLKWSDYNAILKGRVRERFTKPYQMLAQCCMAVALTEVIGSDDIFFLLDRQEGMRREIMHTMRDFVFDRIGVDSRIKGLDFISRTNTVCLDPADYLAFIIRERNIDKSSIKTTLGASILGSESNTGYGGRIGPQHLQWMVDNLNADGFAPDRPLPKQVPKRLIHDLMKNPYWRGPK